MEDDLGMNMAQSIWPYEEEDQGSIRQPQRQSLPAPKAAAPTPFSTLFSGLAARPSDKLVKQQEVGTSAVSAIPTINELTRAAAPPSFSLEAMAGAAGSCSFRSERMAPYSVQLSPIAEIRNMISPQLNASKSPAETNPKLLFIALQQYFEPSSRSVKADGRPAAN